MRVGRLGSSGNGLATGTGRPRSFATYLLVPKFIGLSVPEEQGAASRTGITV